MDDEGLLKRLGETPITELNLGKASFRRVIKNAGFTTLPELLSLSENDIDRLFEWRDADEIINMRERYLEDPEAFASSVLVKKEVDTAAVERTLSKATTLGVKPQRTRQSVTVQTRSTVDSPQSLPPLQFSESLKGFEQRACEVFDNLDDRYQEVMAYQAFEEFSTELDEISDSFAELFAHYSSNPRSAVGLIDKYLRNIFVVYVADRARSVYSDGNLWGNFFEGLGVSDGGIQALFKQVFASQIERRGMPLYARDEEANYYFYTALLHGGLSQDSWENLWDKSLLPLAKEIAKGYYGFGGEMDGHAVLKELKNPESRFAPKKAVLNILEKAPDSTIAPLFEASLKVAAQIEDARKSKTSYTMLSNYGLPEAAMQALRANQEEKAAISTSRSSETRSSGKQSSSRLVYLPMASLQLDLSEGAVSMCWPRQQFPLHFAGSRIDYYVDGNLTLSGSFEISVGKCILEAVKISVKPQARYDVELKLMQRGEENGEFSEVSSLRQTFARSKPGCFEFVKDAKGVFRLRGRNERVSKRRRIAYIVKEGLLIEPGPGMEAVSEYETAGGWDGTQIFVYDVEPGAAGSIVDSLTGDEVAVWQERYTARVDKRRIIGETVDGLDLYGYAPSELGTNGGLPSVSIEALDGVSAIDDLDITCMCDGTRIAMPRRILWADDYGDSKAARIALIPQESSLFDWHIETCEIEARQRSADGKAVFRYRFAVVPIQDFRLRSVTFEYGVAVADYGFQARLAMTVIDSQERFEDIGAWGRYAARTLLRDEFLHVRIESRDSGKSTDAKLALAAIDIDMPDKLVAISEKRPICLADALDLGPSAGNFKIKAYGWRYNRAAMVKMGYEPLFLKELKQPGEHEFNLFRSSFSFMQANDAPPNDRPLTMSIVYGDDVSEGRLMPAWTDIKLLECCEGLGISGWKVLADQNGKSILRFDGVPLCNVHFEFKRKIGGRTVAEVFVSAGSAELSLPASVSRLLDAQKKLLVEVSPTDYWSDEPMREYGTTFTLKR